MLEFICSFGKHLLNAYFALGYTRGEAVNKIYLSDTVSGKKDNKQVITPKII